MEVWHSPPARRPVDQFRVPRILALRPLVGFFGTPIRSIPLARGRSRRASTSVGIRSWRASLFPLVLSAHFRAAAAGYATAFEGNGFDHCLFFGRKVRRQQRQNTSDAEGRQSGAPYA